MFHADQKDIAAAVKLLAPASKHVKQLLFVHDEHGARMEASGHGITLRRFFNRVAAPERQVVAVAPAVLSKWLKVLSGPIVVTVEESDGVLVLKLSTLLRTVEVATVKPLYGDEWATDCGTAVRWDSVAFRQAASVACRDDSGRPIIEAVQVLPDTLAATDSYRLVVVDNTASFPTQPGVLVPAAAAVVMGDRLVTAMTNADTSSEDANKFVQWSTDRLEVQVRCAAAVDQYPAWQNLPPKREHEVGVASGVVAAVDVVMKVRATKASNPVRLIGDEAGWTVEYRDDTGRVSETVAAVDVAELGTVGFNPQYLQDALKLLEAADGETVMWWQDSPVNGPRLFTSPTVPGVRVALMPVRIE